MARNSLVACLLLVAWCRVAGAMEVGTDFWDVGRGGEFRGTEDCSREKVGGES